MANNSEAALAESPIHKFLEPYWAIVQSLTYWERDYLREYVLKDATGWEKYNLYNGYALCAYVWYRQIKGEECFSHWKPKEIMHELRKTLKERKEVLK